MSKRVKSEPLAPATVSAGRIAYVAVAVLGFLGTSMALLAWLFFATVPGQWAPTERSFPQPRLQAHPHDDLRQFLAQQHAQLSGYRWSDAEHTLFTIPIEHAMEIIARRGTQGYDPIPAAPPTPQPKSGAKP